MFNFSKKSNNSPKNLKEILDCFNKLENKVEKLSKEFNNLKLESKFFIKKVGIVRYNPFSDVGGDQSFSVALLDNNNDGIVITSLYSRNGNRVYGKSLKNSSSEHPLSEDEKKAIEKAKKIKDE